MTVSRDFRLLAAAPLLLVVLGAAPLAQQAPAAPPAPEPSDAKARAWQADEGEWQPLPDIFPSGGSMKVMNGSPAVGAADFYFRFPAGYGVPMHFHTPVERVFVEQGTMEFETWDDRTLSIEPGGYVYFPARSPHAARCTSSTDCHFFLSSSGVFDVHLLDDEGNVSRSWSAAAQDTSSR